MEDTSNLRSILQGVRPANAIFLLPLVLLVYLTCGAVYRVFFSPLAKFPGPLLAAVTSWYEAYYDIGLRGRYLWKVQELHEKYGPIIRINPHEIHISDPEYIDSLFTGGGHKRDKFAWQVRTMALPDSTVSTLSHDLHKKRRGPLNPFFSKQAIRRLEPIMQTRLTNLFARMEEYRKAGKVFPAGLAYQALTCDVITCYSFGTSTDYINLPDWNAPYFEAVQKNFEMSHTFKHVRFLGPLMSSLPVPVTKFLMPALKSLFDLQGEWEQQIDAMRRAGPEKSSTDVVFHGLLFGDMPESEKSTRRLRDDAQSLVIAGQDTTARTLSAITFELLDNPRILKKLQDELAQAMPDPNELPTCAKVETLPYLNAVIQEGIRRHSAALLRQARISPDQPLVYNDGQKHWTIPAGEPVSMNAYTVQMNPDIFPNPEEFRPERWIANPRLDRYLLSFSRGTRICLGINLAYQEMYFTLAAMFRRYKLAGEGEKAGERTLGLYDTVKERDIDPVADIIVPTGVVGSKGLQLLIH